MTYIKLDINENEICLTADDHAGDPLVCSAISMMCYSLAETLHDDANLIVLEPGNVLVRCSIQDKEQRAKISACYLMAMNGFVGLAEEHPENVKILP